MASGRSRVSRLGLRSRSACTALALALVLGAVPHGTRAEPPGAAAPLRVLLIGNSYTRFNMMPSLLRRLALSVPDGPPLAVDFEAHGGSTLRRHRLDGRAQAQLMAGRYTHVVLQDHSLRPVDKPDEFYESIARWKQTVDAVHAHTVLFATWPRHQNGAGLAPVGRAFERAVGELPELALYKTDGAHPTMAGSFLAACVIYGAITGIDPRASTYVPWELGPEQGTLVKTLAAETLGFAPLPESMTVAGSSVPEAATGVADPPAVMTTNKPP